MRMNTPMNVALHAIPGCDRLPPPDASAMAGGFRREGDCVVLVGTAPISTNVSRENFPDCTGYEVFLNRIHAYDFCDSGNLIDALGFVLALFAEWQRFDDPRTLRAIVSYITEDAVICWHVVREGESWSGNDFSHFVEGVLEIDSIDEWPLGKMVNTGSGSMND